MGCVYSIQEESAGLGERPNESDKNNPIDEKPNMQNYKNTKKAAVRILCKGILLNNRGKLLFIPMKGGIEGATKTEIRASCLI